MKWNVSVLRRSGECERVSAVAESRLTASNDIYVVLRLRNND